jgi:hypothetical protein
LEEVRARNAEQLRLKEKIQATEEHYKQLEVYFADKNRKFEEES